MSTRAERLSADARNRALRSFVAGLAVDVAVALAFVLYDGLEDTDPDYRLLLVTLAKTAAQTAAAYVMRRFADPSRLPTPLPPEDPGPPVDEGAGELRLIGLVLLALALFFIVLPALF